MQFDNLFQQLEKLFRGNGDEPPRWLTMAVSFYLGLMLYLLIHSMGFI